MKRGSAMGGALGAAIVVFGGFVAVHIVSRFLRAITWFVETVALLGLAVVVGYVAYRVLSGASDDPQRY